MKILQTLTERSDDELVRIRQNAFRILNSDESEDRQSEASTLLEAIDAELDRRHLPGMIELFRERYPGGFYGEKYLEEERNYKVAASSACKESLTKEVFGPLVENQAWDELFEQTKRLVNMTNLIQGSFERPKLFDSIQVPAVAASYYPALYDCLHGDGDPVTRFGRFADILAELELGKWTYATYFPFLADPENSMFVKPEGLRRSLEITRYPLEYESRPNASTYGDILQFSHWLRQKISEFEPRDMIDVQSFIWHMAPTGKWARD